MFLGFEWMVRPPLTTLITWLRCQPKPRQIQNQQPFLFKHNLRGFYNPVQKNTVTTKHIQHECTFWIHFIPISSKYSTVRTMLDITKHIYVTVSTIQYIYITTILSIFMWDLCNFSFQRKPPLPGSHSWATRRTCPPLACTRSPGARIWSCVFL